MSNKPGRFRRARAMMNRAPTPGRADAVLATGRSLELRDGAEGMVPVARGVSLHYRVVGSGSDVLIVPCTGNEEDLLRLASDDDARERRTVLFYDVRSRGQSDAVDDPTRLGFSVEVTDLEAVRQSFGIESFAAFGWSYHAGVVATYAIQHPERITRAVLASAIPSHAGAEPGTPRSPTPGQVAELDQLEAAGLRESDPAALCRAWRAVYIPLLFGDESRFEAMAPVCAYPNEWPWKVARSMVFVFAQLQSYDWRPHLRNVPVPTLVVHGTTKQDPVDEAEEWVQALPDARLLELEGVGRFPWIEVPDAFFGPVNRFLAGEPV